MLEAPDDLPQRARLCRLSGTCAAPARFGREKRHARHYQTRPGRGSRRTLVLAAQTLLIRAAKDAKAGQPLDRLRQWALDLAARKHRNVAVTAIAARLARIAWAVIARNTPYRSKPAAA